jgi:membrane-bound lytic murein transglycosylase B
VPIQKEPVVIRAYRTKKRFFPKRLFLSTITLSGASAFAVLVLSTWITANIYAARSENKPPQEAFYTVESPDDYEPMEQIQVNNAIQPIQPATSEQLEIERLKELEARIAARIASQVVVRGGFENVYARAEKKYGVPRQILAAVHYVETGQRGDTTVGSYAGAKGPMQFMQSTFNHYAQDGDGDGIASIYDVHDAIFSAANMLAQNGAAQGKIIPALYTYNHSYAYVEKVLTIAEKFGFAYSNKQF